MYAARSDFGVPRVTSQMVDIASQPVTMSMPRTADESISSFSECLWWWLLTGWVQLQCG
jgi:hypothetical protein